MPMSDNPTRSTVYFDSELHRALRMKAALTHRSISELVNQAVRDALLEDEEDLRAFEERSSESTLSYADLLKDLKKHGKI